MSKGQAPGVESISAITLGVADMARSVAFYMGMGFVLRYGGPAASFSSFEAGKGYLNLIADAPGGWWGRIVFHVSDVDEMYLRAETLGANVLFAPRDAAWNERYFHVLDPDGHELSFARPIVGTGHESL